jgi:hypothetical protein
MGDRSGVEKTVPLIAVVDDDESVRAAMDSTACRRASWPTSRSPVLVKATTEIEYICSAPWASPLSPAGIYRQGHLSNPLSGKSS